MSVESETFEEKSQVVWSPAGKQFDLVKTIIAFANCSGGQILINEFVGDVQLLDSARLHDFVNKYVDPPVGGITSYENDEGSWVIYVAKSAFAPHVMSHTLNYSSTGKSKVAFQAGHVYVRHGSKSEPAAAQDFQRMVREGVSSWLSSLGEAVAKIGLLENKSGEGVPMRIVDGGPALSISVAESHPYSATDLGKPFGKKGSWVGKLINKENMRGDLRYTRTLGLYSSPICCFSEAAKKRVSDILEANPNYNPYS